MPGDRKHHTDKWHSCVDKVSAQGHNESSASAICTASLQKAGEPIFQGAESRSLEEFTLLEDAGITVNARQLHLLGATGTSRVEVVDGKEWLVVPTIALMEGVIHPVNARTPEFVSAAVLEKAAPTWNGKPITLGHPTKGGKQCSANDPAIHASHGIGEVRNARYENKKLLCESWIDTAKAEKLHPAMLARLRANEREEVSVGAFVFTDDTVGDFNGKTYKAAWLETKGDHLAFLPGGRGACSVAMGCGTHRAAMHLVTAEGFEEVPDVVGLTMTFTTLSGDSLDERIRAVNDAVQKRWGGGALAQPSGYAYAQAVFDDRVIVRKDEELYSVNYAVDADGNVTFTGEPIKVEQTYVAAKAKYEDCPACKGSGNAGGNPCEACGGAGELRTAVGARNSEADARIIQSVHDQTVSLGAECDRKNYKMLEVKLDGKKIAAAILEAAAAPQLKAACGCQGESTMTKEKKAELIAALTTDKYSGFKEGDVAFLETASDARLEEFKAAAEANKAAAEKATKDEDDLRAAQAKITVIEGKLKTAEAAPTEEEWIKRAPAGVKTLLENQKAQEAEVRESLIKELKAAGANTEDELKAMGTEQLKTLAKYAKVAVPDFSGRAIPQHRAAEETDLKKYSPPDPYGPGLKALQDKAVN